jgi:hypothetical protein
VHELVGEEWPINDGVGVGTPAEVPWLAVYPPYATPSAQSGFYVVYLFAADGSAVYLSLIQGTEKVLGGMSPLLKRALDLRAAAGLSDSGDRVDLRSAAARPRKYEAGSAYAIRYAADAVPDDRVLANDLHDFLGYLTNATTSGLHFDPEIEPLHLLFKWAADRETRTVDLHRQVANAHGSVWWGRFGHSDGPVGETKLDQLKQQLAKGKDTFVFLYGGGETVRTRLEAITHLHEEVDEDLVPTYYKKSDCDLFVRLSRFSDLPGAWPLSHLVIANDPDPSKMPSAVGNTTSPLFVFELFVPSDAPADKGGLPVLSMEWLLQRTLWTKPDLEDLLVAIGKPGQVILAGPPGTGKTWVAKHVARYLTQDQPLQIRTAQFHPSYGYEEFVEGLRPVAEHNAIAFKVTPGVILDIAKSNGRHPVNSCADH